MEPPNLVKVVAAFVTGLVIALGSALIYVRADEMLHAQPVAVAQNQPEAAPLPTNPRSLPTNFPPKLSQPSVTPVVPHPAPVEQPDKPSPKTAARHQIVVVPTPRRPQPKIALPQLAQIRPTARPVKYELPPVEPPLLTEPPSPVEAEPQQPSSSQPLRPQPIVAQPLVPQPHVVILPAGTPLPIRLAEPLSTDRNYTGDTFRATLAEPIISDGFIIADRGSKVLGRVVNSDHNLRLTLTEINTTDGQRVPVDTSTFDRQTPSNISQDAATIAGGAALGAMIGAAAGSGKGAAIGAGVGSAAGTAVVLASRTRTTNLPVETRITFRLASPLTLTEKLN